MHIMYANISIIIIIIIFIIIVVIIIIIVVVVVVVVDSVLVQFFSLLNCIKINSKYNEAKM